MKNRIIFICFFLTLLTGITNAGSLHVKLMDTSQVNLTRYKIPQTEIFIDNNSTETVWIAVNGELELLPEGFTLQLYNDDEEINEVHIKMSKSVLYGVFFDELVANHSKLRVNDYLPKPDSIS